MKVKDFICFCGKLGNLELPVRYANDDDGREALQDDRVQNLLHGLNCALEEVWPKVGEVRKASVRAENGKIDLYGLNLCRVISLTAHHREIAYRFSGNALSTDVDGEFTLVYVCSPPKAVWGGEVVLPAQLNETTVAYGVLSNYFLSAGDLSMSSVWRERFGEAFKRSVRKSSSMSMPVGRWLR